MKLKLYSQSLYLCKLKPKVDPTGWQSDNGPLNVVIRDPHGVTAICLESDAIRRQDEVLERTQFRCFQIDEVFSVDSIGVVAEFSRLLAENEISLFVISSFETDYLLVQPHQATMATNVFMQAGHRVESISLT